MTCVGGSKAPPILYIRYTLERANMANIVRTIWAIFARWCALFRISMGKPIQPMKVHYRCYVVEHATHSYSKTHNFFHNALSYLVVNQRYRKSQKLKLKVQLFKVPEMLGNVFCSSPTRASLSGLLSWTPSSSISDFNSTCSCPKASITEIELPTD